MARFEGLENSLMPYAEPETAREYQREYSHRFPIHVVTTWLGNSPRIDSEHYLSVREEDFDRHIWVGAATARKG